MLVVVMVMIIILNTFLFVFLLILNFLPKTLNSSDPHFSIHLHSTSSLNKHSVVKINSPKRMKDSFYMTDNYPSLFYDSWFIQHISVFISPNS